MVDKQKGVPTPRTVLSVALIMYCSAIVVLAWFPRNNITWVEWFSSVLAWLAIIGLVAHATELIRLPGEEYAYLVSGWSGFTTTMLYLVHSNDSTSRRTAIALMLMTGVVASYGAYLSEVDGVDDG